MVDSLNIVCTHCNSVNRVPTDRLGEGGKCGKCHARLFIGQPVALGEQCFFRHIERNDIPVLVDFWAAWCGPCKMMTPVFEQAAHQLEPHARLAKLDTEAARGIAMQYSIRSIPTLVLFKNGQEVARMSGAMDLQSLLNWTRQYL